MKQSDFNGFHNSFDAYCDWCEAQDVAENKVSWGEWWDSLEDK